MRKGAEGKKRKGRCGLGGFSMMGRGFVRFCRGDLGGYGEGAGAALLFPDECWLGTGLY